MLCAARTFENTNYKAKVRYQCSLPHFICAPMLHNVVLIHLKCKLFTKLSLQ